jgi:AraC-like DNA-binding protein
VHNGGAYGDWTTEIDVGFGFGAARTAGKLGQLSFSSSRAGASSQDYLVERLWEERPRDCPATGDEQEHGRPVATTVPGTQGVSGLYDELRPGRPRPISDERVAQLVRKTLKSKPKAATHWSIRQIADETGVSKSTVHRIWQAFGLQPHRQSSSDLARSSPRCQRLGLTAAILASARISAL